MKNIYLRYLSITLRGQLRYPANFWLSAAGSFLISLSTLAGIVLLFQRFGSLAGYTLAQALLCYGVINLSFALAETISRGFDSFSGILAKGEFDRILVRPRAVMLQVLGSRFEISRIGRLSASTAVLVWAVQNAGVDWTALKVITLVLMVGGGFLLFTGLFVLGASLAFRTTDSLEIINVFTDGGREMGQYPLDIYAPLVKRFFTFVVPFACVNYLPLLFLLDRPGSGPWAAALPLAGGVFLLPCFWVWSRGCRHFVSTGS